MAETTTKPTADSKELTTASGNGQPQALSVADARAELDRRLSSMITSETAKKTMQIRAELTNAREMGQLCDLAKDHITKGVIQAAAMAKLKALMDDKMLQILMGGMGSKRGFVTDRDHKTQKYDIKVVREALIDGMLAGFYPVNNEINIIAGGFYGAKAGFRRLIEEWPGVSNLVVRPLRAIPEPGIWAVPGFISWTYYGEPKTIDCRQSEAHIVVARYETDKVDGARAKGVAEARLLRMCYSELSGIDNVLAAEEYTPEAVDANVVQGTVEHTEQPALGLAGEPGEGEPIQTEIQVEPSDTSFEPSDTPEEDSQEAAAGDTTDEAPADQVEEDAQKAWRGKVMDSFEELNTIKRCDDLLAEMLQDPELSEEDRMHLRQAHVVRTEAIRKKRKH